MHKDVKGLPDEAWAGALLVSDYMNDQRRSRSVLEWLHKALTKKR